MGAWADKAGLQPLLPQQCPPESWASLGFSVSCPELTAYMRFLWGKLDPLHSLLCEHSQPLRTEGDSLCK